MVEGRKQRRVNGQFSENVGQYTQINKMCVRFETENLRARCFLISKSSSKATSRRKKIIKDWIPIKLRREISRAHSRDRRWMDWWEGGDLENGGLPLWPETHSKVSVRLCVIVGEALIYYRKKKKLFQFSLMLATLNWLTFPSELQPSPLPNDGNDVWRRWKNISGELIWCWLINDRRLRNRTIRTCRQFSHSREQLCVIFPALLLLFFSTSISFQAFQCTFRIEMCGGEWER